MMRRFCYRSYVGGSDLPYNLGALIAALLVRPRAADGGWGYPSASWIGCLVSARVMSTRLSAEESLTLSKHVKPAT